MKPNRLRRTLVTSAACACLLAPAVAVAQGSPENTAMGTVQSVAGPGILEVTQAGITSTCEYWQTTLVSGSGQKTLFDIESPTSGSTATGFTPTDPTALQTLKTLNQAEADGKNAVVTVSYVASEIDCGYNVPDVVTSASVTLAVLTSEKKEGRVTKMSVPTFVSAVDGELCNVWHGALKTKSGQFTFAVESESTSGNPKPRVLKLVTALDKALAEGKKAVVELTYTGPIYACGLTLTHVVTEVSIKGRAAMTDRR